MMNIFNTLIMATGPAGAIDESVRNVIEPIFMILMVLCSIALMVVIMMQKSTSDNVSAIAGGKSESYYGKNKAQTKEGVLRKLTVGLGVAMLVLSIVFFILAQI